MVELAGDLPIGSYTRSQVNSLRGKLLSSGLATASVRRQLSTLSALVNYVSKELGLDSNPTYSGVIIHEIKVDAEIQKRPSVPLDVITAIQQRCYQMDDEARWAIALVSDTGLRLSEALGLLFGLHREPRHHQRHHSCSHATVPLMAARATVPVAPSTSG